MKLVEVDWIDSAFNQGWGDAKEARKSMHAVRCRSVGYLLDSDADCVKIVQSRDVDCDLLSGGISIPRVAVKRIRTLKGGF